MFKRMFPYSLQVGKYGDISDEITNCCDEISDPTLIHATGWIARIMIRLKQESFMEYDLIEKSRETDLIAL